jgi:hypothetical protein
MPAISAQNVASPICHGALDRHWECGICKSGAAPALLLREVHPSNAVQCRRVLVVLTESASHPGSLDRLGANELAVADVLEAPNPTGSDAATSLPGDTSTTDR